MKSQTTSWCLFILTITTGVLTSSVPPVPNHLNSEGNTIPGPLGTEDGGVRETLGTFIQVEKPGKSNDHVDEVVNAPGAARKQVQGPAYTRSGPSGIEGSRRIYKGDSEAGSAPQEGVTQERSHQHGQESQATRSESQHTRPDGFKSSASQESQARENVPRAAADNAAGDQFMPMMPLPPADSVDAAVPLELPPRSSRDYPVSSDNYGWTYPSASGAPSTGGGSASYYPSPEYGKPAATAGADSKYYGWAGPGTDDKYKRPSYFTYSVNQGGTPVECIPLPMAGIITEMTKGGTAGKTSIVRTLLQGLVGLFLLKIPVMIALKVLFFKLFLVPATLFMASLPVLMPLLYFFLPSFMKDKDKSTTAKPATMVMMMTTPNSTRGTRGLFEDPPGGRRARTLFHEDGTVTEDFEQLMRSLIGEQSCVEKIACQFGVRDAQSQYRKPISWVLKYVQTLGPVLSDPALRTKFKMYREAYNFGADIAASNATEESRNAEVVCADTLYPCQKPQVIVKQARTIYKLV